MNRPYRSISDAVLREDIARVGAMLTRMQSYVEHLPGQLKQREDGVRSAFGEDLLNQLAPLDYAAFVSAQYADIIAIQTEKLRLLYEEREERDCEIAAAKDKTGGIAA